MIIKLIKNILFKVLIPNKKKQLGSKDLIVYSFVLYGTFSLSQIFIFFWLIHFALTIRLFLLIYRKSSFIKRTAKELYNCYYILFENFEYDFYKRKELLKETLIYTCGIITILINVLLVFNYYMGDLSNDVLDKTVIIHMFIFSMSITLYLFFNLLKFPVVNLFFSTLFGFLLLIFLLLFLIVILISIIMVAGKILFSALSGKFELDIISYLITNQPFKIHELLLGTMQYMTESGNFLLNICVTLFIYLLSIILIPQYSINNLKSGFNIINYLFNMLIMMLVFMSSELSKKLYDFLEKRDSNLLAEFLEMREIETVSNFSELFEAFLFTTILPYIIGSFISLIFIEQVQKLYLYKAKKSYREAIRLSQKNDFEGTVRSLRTSLLFGGEDYEMHIRNNFSLSKYLNFLKGRQSRKNSIHFNNITKKIKENITIILSNIRILPLRIDFFLFKIKKVKGTFYRFSVELGKNFLNIVKPNLVFYTGTLFTFYLSSLILKMEFRIYFFYDTIILFKYMSNLVLLIYPLIFLYFNFCFLIYGKNENLHLRFVFLLVSISLTLILLFVFIPEFLISYNLLRFNLNNELIQSFKI